MNTVKTRTPYETVLLMELKMIKESLEGVIQNDEKMMHKTQIILKKICGRINKRENEEKAVMVRRARYWDNKKT